jgi:hypothetical protein
MREGLLYSSEFLRDSANVLFAGISHELLPNEEIIQVSETNHGFCVLTQRRLIFMSNSKVFGPPFTKHKIFTNVALNPEIISQLERTEKGHWILEYNVQDASINTSSTVNSITIKSPKQSRAERNQGDVKQTFDTALRSLSELIKSMKERFQDVDFSPVTDVSYVAELIDKKPVHSTHPFTDIIEPESIYIPNVGDSLFIGEKVTVTKRSESASSREILHSLDSFPNSQIRALIAPLAMPYLSVYFVVLRPKYKESTKKQKQDESLFIDYLEMPVYPILDNEYPDARWLWSPQNRPWIIADAFYYKTKRFIPAVLENDNERKGKFWY